jgi:hypothetical protein
MTSLLLHGYSQLPERGLIALIIMWPSNKTREHIFHLQLKPIIRAILRSQLGETFKGVLLNMYEGRPITDLQKHAVYVYAATFCKRNCCIVFEEQVSAETE